MTIPAAVFLLSIFWRQAILSSMADRQIITLGRVRQAYGLTPFSHWNYGEEYMRLAGRHLSRAVMQYTEHSSRNFLQLQNRIQAFRRICSALT